VLVRLRAISVEGGDLLNRRLIAPKSFPHVVGYQGAGVVEALGPEVTKVQVGQRVVAFNWYGSHAEIFSVPEHYVYPIPDTLDFDLASTIPVAFGTAHDALFEFGRLEAGETVLIQGAAGGVGLAALQLAKATGATVIGTSSNNERLARLAGFGLDYGINYLTEDIAKRTRALTNGIGADLVVDMAGGRTIKALLSAVAYRGRLSVVGASSGELPSLEFFDLIRKNLTVFGISFGMEMHTPRAHALLRQLIHDVAAGKLNMPIDARFSLAEAAAAHAYVEQGHPFGRVLMVPEAFRRGSC
jgi:NADPH2:quinone reductase